MVGFKGPSQEKSGFEIIRFGYRKASSDPAGAGVPDPRRLRGNWSVCVAQLMFAECALLWWNLSLAIIFHIAVSWI